MVVIGVEKKIPGFFLGGGNRNCFQLHTLDLPSKPELQPWHGCEGRKKQRCSQYKAPMVPGCVVHGRGGSMEHCPYRQKDVLLYSLMGDTTVYMRQGECADSSYSFLKISSPKCRR